MCLLDDRLYRVVGELNPLFASGNFDGGSSISGFKRTNDWKLKQPLGVGLGVAGDAGQLRQPGTHQHNRQVSLGRTMDGRNQGSQLDLNEILDLVDSEEDATVPLNCRFTRGDEQITHVVLQVPAVCGSAERVDIDRHTRTVWKLNVKAFKTRSAFRTFAVFR